MERIRKLVAVLALAAGMDTAMALPSLRLETVTPENQGAIEADELEPAFSRNLPVEAPAPTPKVEAKNEKKNDILSLFRDDQQPKVQDVNPLEEQAAREMKAADDPENRGGNQTMVQVGENEKAPEVDIKPSNAPKEIELDTASQDMKGLPGILK